jgi:membrane protease YdiL (CAAX protease family)
MTDVNGGRSAPPQPTWRAVETIPVFLLALVGTVVLTFVVAAITAGALGWPLDRILSPPAQDARACVTMSVVGVASQEAAFLVTVLLWVRFVSKAPLGALGAPRRPLGDAMVGIGTGLAIVVVAGIVLAITTSIAEAILGHPPEEPVQVASCVATPFALVLMGPVVIIAAPLAEETLFRGFLYSGLRRRFSVWPAAAISSALFGLVHFGGLEFALIIPALFVVGLGLALVYERRRSLLASILAHATFNVAGFVSIVLSRLR